MGLITYVKTSIMKHIIDSLTKTGIRVKVLGDNFDEANDNRAQTSCEINVLYVNSEWTVRTPATKTANTIYDRTLNFNVILKVKKINNEDPAQDLNDLLIDVLTPFRIADQQITLSEDSFEELDEGVWVYLQQWALLVKGVSAIDPTDPICTFPIDGPAFTSIEVSIVPSFNIGNSDKNLGVVIPRNN